MAGAQCLPVDPTRRAQTLRRRRYGAQHYGKFVEDRLREGDGYLMAAIPFLFIIRRDYPSPQGDTSAPTSGRPWFGNTTAELDTDHLLRNAGQEQGSFFCNTEGALNPGLKAVHVNARLQRQDHVRFQFPIDTFGDWNLR